MPEYTSLFLWITYAIYFSYCVFGRVSNSLLREGLLFVEVIHPAFDNIFPLADRICLCEFILSSSRLL